MTISDCHVLKIYTRDVANGPGIRVSVWTSGCTHQCPGCHNPETWKWKQGTPLTEELIQKILDACDKPYIQGLTLTGGDPLFPKSRKGVERLLEAFRERFADSKDVWLWTGYLFKSVKHLALMKYVDVVVDGQYIEALRDVSLPYSGSRNQRIISIKDSL